MPKITLSVQAYKFATFERKEAKPGQAAEGCYARVVGTGADGRRVQALGWDDGARHLDRSLEALTPNGMSVGEMNFALELTGEFQEQKRRSGERVWNETIFQIDRKDGFSILSGPAQEMHRARMSAAAAYEAAGELARTGDHEAAFRTLQEFVARFARLEITPVAELEAAPEEPVSAAPAPPVALESPVAAGLPEEPPASPVAAMPPPDALEAAGAPVAAPAAGTADSAAVAGSEGGPAAELAALPAVGPADMGAPAAEALRAAEPEEVVQADVHAEAAVTPAEDAQVPEPPVAAEPAAGLAPAMQAADAGTVTAPARNAPQAAEAAPAAVSAVPRAAPARPMRRSTLSVVLANPDDPTRHQEAADSTADDDTASVARTVQTGPAAVPQRVQSPAATLPPETPEHAAARDLGVRAMAPGLQAPAPVAAPASPARPGLPVRRSTMAPLPSAAPAQPAARPAPAPSTAPARPAPPPLATRPAPSRAFSGFGRR